MSDIKKVLNECNEINKEYNYFNVIDNNAKFGKGKLKDYAISVKDCVCVKDLESTAGSKILKGYKPMFNATCVQKVVDEGGAIIGKTAQDEFGFGGFSVNVGVGFDIPKNPFDKTRVCGGSSGGAAGITQKAKFEHIAIAESTGGSIVNPASFCGVVGLCPSYGAVSRYGLIDYANSLDKIGAMGKNIEDVNLLFDVMKGHDDKDSTSLDSSFTDGKVGKVAIIKEAFELEDKEVKEICLKKLDKIDYEEVNLPLTMKYGIPTYYIIALAEASTNLAKYCGLRYGMQGDAKGSYNEYFSKIRSENLGKEAKRRIIIGTFVRMAGYRDAYYIKALKIRSKIISEYKNLFKKYDVLFSPTMPIVAPKISEVSKLSPLQNYLMDNLTVGSNLAGLPHMTINAGFSDDMPVGLMSISDHLCEEKLFSINAKIYI